MTEMYGLTFKDNSKEFSKNFEKMGIKMLRYVRQSYYAMGNTWISLLKKPFTGYGGKEPWGVNTSGRGAGATLQTRTGNLKRGIGAPGGKPVVLGNKLGNTRLILRVGGKAGRYAAMQEYGGRITSSKAMTIPIDFALTPTGQVKESAKIRKSGSSASGYTTGLGDTFIHKNIVFAKRTPRSKPRALYILTKNVKIPARLGARGIMFDVVKKSVPQMGMGILKILLMDPNYPPRATGK